MRYQNKWLTFNYEYSVYDTVYVRARYHSDGNRENLGSAGALVNEHRDDDAAGNRPLNDRARHARKSRDNACVIQRAASSEIAEYPLIDLFFCRFFP